MDERATELARRAERIFAAPLSLDLAEPNALAAELAAICGDLRTGFDAAGDRAGDDLAADAAALGELRRLQDRLRTHVLGIRLRTLERIHEGLARLRAEGGTATLPARATEELARCCQFDRTMVSVVRRGTWRAAAVWIATDHEPELARRIFDHVTTGWLPLGSGVLETELVRRRIPVLVRSGAAQDPNGLMAISQSRAYVAAPIIANARVIGFLHADCVRAGRDLTTFDRDNVATFAEGFGLVFERAALLERLERQRARVHDAFVVTERQLAGLGDTETVLIRRDREAVAVVRMAAGLRRIAISPIEALLTVRERQVLELMVEGARNRQIADSLVISEETVKSHVRTISRKLRASSRADAVARYLRMRLQEAR